MQLYIGENGFTQENFPQKENFVKCDWPTHYLPSEKKLKMTFKK